MASYTNKFRRSEEEICAMIDEVRESKAPFWQSIVSQYDRGFVLSDKQIACLEREVEGRQATRNVVSFNREHEIPTELYAELYKALMKAREAGAKHPTLRFENLVISMAPANGKNPNALYVKTPAGSYYGKVVGNVFERTYDAPAGILVQLREIAEKPLEAAIRYGRMTGRCSCCGRTLENKESIERGIGPICAEKFGW